MDQVITSDAEQWPGPGGSQTPGNEPREPGPP